MTERRLARFVPLAPFVLLAYVPALLSSPGRMPADSKLYLYLDPGGFFAEAASSFDPGQFAGWVPHQHIAHLWPGLPWFWSFEALGVPDWIAHRLWIGTLFLLAGLGVRHCARSLALVGHGALVAGLVYQTSPYVLPYVSRTSVMLLPWAGLGWILAFTITACRHRTWASIAPIALVVVTVGAVNATALLLVVPAPVAWLIHEAARGALPVRAAIGVAARTGLLCSGVSAWWVAALVIQGRYGASVLPYSEALADVSAASTSSEVWRGLGYWLFYVRDVFAPTTTSAGPYLTSSVLIGLSYVVPLIGLAGLVWVRWVHRRFAAALIAIGGVVSVGVHPFEDRSPLVALLSGGGDDGLLLALRSSTRALPVMVLGLALAAGSLVAAVPLRRPRRVVTLAIVVVAVVGQPALWTAALVDPAIDRDQDPPRAWIDAAAGLDDGSRRVLVLPGSEFGAYRWGYTVDPALPGLTDVPVVTRDLLPLGSPAAMDLLYAFDDRFQDGVAEPSTLAPVARLLGVGTIWLANDNAFDRFRTARPELVRDVVTSADGVGNPVAFGAPAENRPEIAMVDEAFLDDGRVGTPLPPVELVELDEPGAVVRVAERTLLVAGSGDGLVDAAAAGFVRPGVVVRYTADGVDVDPSVVGLVVTDSNRDRARHWRGSQDTTGYTESGAPGDELLRASTGDARLPVFESTDPSGRTVAVQTGSVTATATSYGERFAYTPEHRPVMAVDGDPATAWLVGEHGDPVGESIRLTIDGAEPIRTIRLAQWPSGDRRIAVVDVIVTDERTGASERRRIELDDRSRTPGGQPVDVSTSVPVDAPMDVTIDVTIIGIDGPGTDPVGFGEIDPGLGPTLEVVRVPDPGTDADLPTARVFTRSRTDPLDHWRDDPEPTLVRSWNNPRPVDVSPTYTVRLDARAPDSDLAEWFGWPVVADRRLTGSLRSVGAAAFDGDATTSWTSPFGDVSGRIRVEGVDRTIDRVRIVQPILERSTITAIELRSADEIRRIRLDGLADATVVVDPPLEAGDLEIVVAEVVVATTIDRRFGDVVELPVSISEIEFEGAPRLEPLDRTSLSRSCTTLGSIDGRPFSASIRLEGSGWLDGDPLEVTPCEDRLRLDAGDHLLLGADGPLDLDRVVLDDGLAETIAGGDGSDAGSVVALRRDRTGGRFRVVCPAGCWFVFGEGFNAGWRASSTGGPLGAPTLVDGGFNGWWVEPGTTDVVVDWRPRRLLWVAIALSAAATLSAIGLVARRRVVGGARAVGEHATAGWSDGPVPAPWRTPTPLSGIAVVVAWTAPAALLVGPGWGLLAGLGGAVAHRHRTVPLAALGALATVATVGVGVVALELRRAPAHDLGWPAAFEPLHGFGMLAFALLVTSVVTDSDSAPMRLSRGAGAGTPDAAGDATG